MTRSSAALTSAAALFCGILAGFGIASIPQSSFEIPYESVLDAAEIRAAQSEVYTVNSSAALMININTAGKDELTKLSGIGEVKANAIIKYREENGFFISIDEIKNVSGIGGDTFEKIKDHICVS